MHKSAMYRIEDTDRERNTPESEAAVLEDVKWLGLEWDEGKSLLLNKQRQHTAVFCMSAHSMTACLAFCSSPLLHAVFAIVMQVVACCRSRYHHL